MNRFKYLTAAVVFMAATNSAVAGQQCDAQAEKVSQELNYVITDTVEDSMAEALAAIEELDSSNQPVKFTIDLTLGTGARIIDGTADLAEEGAEAIEKGIVSLYESGACTLDAAKEAQLLEGVNCVVNWPGKALMISVDGAEDGVAVLTATVTDVTGGVFGALSELAFDIDGRLSKRSRIGAFLGAPFVVAGVTAQTGQALVQFAGKGVMAIVSPTVGVVRDLGCLALIEIPTELLKDKNPREALRTLFVEAPQSVFKNVRLLFRGLGDSLLQLDASLQDIFGPAPERPIENQLGWNRR